MQNMMAMSAVYIGDVMDMVKKTVHHMNGHVLILLMVRINSIYHMIPMDTNRYFCSRLLTCPLLRSSNNHSEISTSDNDHYTNINHINNRNYYNNYNNNSGVG